jgi:deoxycytidine triphosphate deaminase
MHVRQIARTRIPPDKLVALEMVDSLGRFGVLTTDGNPKPGWNELRKQISHYYNKQRIPRRF